MASIRYTSIINAWVSTEGSNGVMTNYVYYSVLVAYDNGSKDIVTGKYESIRPLLSYVRTPMDELEELKETVGALRHDLETMVDQKMTLTVESLFPIPDVGGLNEDEARQRIRGAGLEPVSVNPYPESTPHHGVVRSFVRCASNFKKVELNIIHEVPPVTGMQEAEAIRLLQAEGFTVSIRRTLVTDRPHGTVLSWNRSRETSLDLTLEIAVSVPDTVGLSASDAIIRLKNAGFEYRISKIFNDSAAPGTVLRWSSLGEREVGLLVSAGPAVTAAKSVQMTYEQMQGSAGGDRYRADAVFDGQRNLLQLTITYTIQGKNKHTLAGITAKSATDAKPSLTDIAGQMVPGQQGSFGVNVPYEMPVGELPDRYEFVLQTQYGLIKKDENIAMTFTFEW